MKRFFLRLSLLVPVVFVAVLFAILVWLFETESGLRWTYAQLQERVPGTLEIATLDGRLAGPIRITGLSYKNDGVDLRVKDARIAWAPAALLVGRLQIDALAIDDVHIRTLGNRTRRASGRQFGLPLNVAVENLRIEHIRVETNGGATQIVDSVELAGVLGQAIARIDRLKIAAPRLQVEANGAVALTEKGDQTIRVRWRADPKAEWSIAGSGEIRGNLSRLTVAQHITQPAEADIRGEVRELTTDPRWQVRVNFPEFDTHRLGLLDQALLLSGTIDARGGLVRYEAMGRLRAKSSVFPELAGDFAVNGTTSADEVVLDNLAVTVPGTDGQLTARARWQPLVRAWAASIEWQQLQWPLTGEAALRTPKGTLEASGDYERYSGRIDVATTSPNLPSARWRGDVAGNKKSIAFSEVTIETLGSTLSGTAQVAWSPQLHWHTQLSGTELNPAVTWPEWSGSLALRAVLSGDRDELRADIQSLKGRLRNQTFEARASVIKHHDNYPHVVLDVAAGEAKVNVGGSLNDDWNLVWRVAVPDLATLIPNYAGNVRGDGRLSGPRLAPHVEMRASADRLAFAETQVGKVSIDAAVDLSDSTVSHATLSATQVIFLRRELERLTVTVNGFRSNHDIVAEAQSTQATLSAALRGAFANRTWAGKLIQSAARLGSETWSLVAQPQLVVGSDSLQLDKACWQGGNSRACVKLNGALSAPLNVTVSSEELPLALITPLLPNPPDWHGTVSGETTLQFDGARLTRAQGRVELSAGEVTLLDSARSVFAYDRATARFSVDEHGLHANADVALPGDDGGSMDFSMPQFHSNVTLDRQPISGRLIFAMHNLAPVAALFPQLEDMSGMLKLQFDVTGSLADPRIQGDASLSGGAARINATGIRVHDVRLTLRADGSDELQLSGEAKSGSGRLELSGRLTFPDDRAWRAELHIVGDQFHVADLRENQVYVTPDLKLALAPGEVVVDGSVRIPKASFGLRSPKSNLVETSSDVVLVNAPANVVKSELRWKVIAQIRVVLGDEVTFAGFGLNAKIAGDVALVEIPGQPATANGEIRVVKGQYDAYGQKLEVQRGRLIFVGGPVANPGIDARAVRKIDQITAGVEIKGTLQEPRLSLFSDPAMSQSDALSYLVFGRPLEGASAEEGRSLAAAARALKLAGGEQLAQRIGSVFGIEEVGIETGAKNESAALVLGKQLSPRLYVNYSIGLFTPTNVFHLKYKLSQRWSLEAQSGAQAGGDLIFSIEK